MFLFAKSSCSGSMSIFWRCKLHSIRLVKRDLEFIASFCNPSFEWSYNPCSSNKFSTQPFISQDPNLLQRPTSLVQRRDPRLPVWFMLSIDIPFSQMIHKYNDFLHLLCTMHIRFKKLHDLFSYIPKVSQLNFL